MDCGDGLLGRADLELGTGADVALEDLLGGLNALLVPEERRVVLRVLPEEQRRQRLLIRQEGREALDVILELLARVGRVGLEGVLALCEAAAGRDTGSGPCVRNRAKYSWVQVLRTLPRVTTIRERVYDLVHGFGGEALVELEVLRRALIWRRNARAVRRRVGRRRASVVHW